MERGVRDVSESENSGGVLVPRFGACLPCDDLCLGTRVNETARARLSRLVR